MWTLRIIRFAPPIVTVSLLIIQAFPLLTEGKMLRREIRKKKKADYSSQR